MYELLCLLLVLHAWAMDPNAALDPIICNGTIFHDVYFDLDMIATNVGKPINLFYHKKTKILFFSQTRRKRRSVDFVISRCDTVSKYCDTIDNVPGGYAIGYDIANDELFFGGHEGIYKYSFSTSTAEFYAEEGKSIWGLFIKKNFYYIEYPSQKLYVYEDNGFTKVAEAKNYEIDHFYISNYFEIYFYNKTGVFKIERPITRPVLLDDEIMVRQIVEDAYGDVYFCCKDGIYIEQRPFRRLMKVADLDNAFGMTFDDNDNIFYSNAKKIYHLLPSENKEICYKSVKQVRRHFNSKSIPIRLNTG